MTHHETRFCSDVHVHAVRVFRCRAGAEGKEATSRATAATADGVCA